MRCLSRDARQTIFVYRLRDDDFRLTYNIANGTFPMTFVQGTDIYYLTAHMSNCTLHYARKKLAHNANEYRVDVPVQSVRFDFPFCFVLYSTFGYQPGGR